jgi:hypothetical protein
VSTTTTLDQLINGAIYELDADVYNAHPDRRSKSILRAALIPAGTRFQCILDRYDDRVAVSLELFPRSIHRPNYVGKLDPLFPVLLPQLRRILPLSLSHNDWLAAYTVASAESLLIRAIQQGKLSREQVLALDTEITGVALPEVA